MGIEVQKSALPTLFNFVRIRAASQPHVTRAVVRTVATGAFVPVNF